ncbi:MAG TPA: DUF2905 domain-containing protein [Candidatus Limnocylindria bacterium]|nr:DUF2905 domain-containing protein [Candidatus Limnocylindria bacterium]
MNDLEPVGRSLLLVGLLLAAVGLLLVIAPRVPFLGRLPGDIRFERDGLVVVIPLATMLLVSVVLTIVLSIVGRGK